MVRNLPYTVSVVLNRIEILEQETLCRIPPFLEAIGSIGFPKNPGQYEDLFRQWPYRPQPKPLKFQGCLKRLVPFRDGDFLGVSSC